MKDKIVALIQGADITDDGEVSLARSLSFLLRSNFEGAIVCQGQLFLYDSGLWSRLTRDVVLSCIQAFNGLPWIAGDKQKVVKLSHSKVVGIFNSLLVCRELLDDTFFDNVPAGVSFLNGFVAVDGPKITIERHSPDQRATMQIEENIPAKPSEAVPNEFISFLNELFLGEDDAAEKVVLLRQFIGMALAGLAATDGQKALLLYGGRGNGKSVLIEAITSLFDPMTVVSSSPSRWSEEYYIHMLHPPARLNVCSELPEQSKGSSSETFKQVVSADVVTGREAYGKPVSFRPKCAHIFAANSLPSSVSGDYSHGFFRRWIILELKREFTKENTRRSPRDIQRGLKGERGTIIIWALRAVAKVLRTGEYSLPVSSAKVFQDWKVETNPVADFIECCAERSENFEKFSYVYDEYKDWSMAAGRKTMSKIMFGRRLTECEIKWRKEATGKAVALRMRPRTEWLDFTHH